MSAMMNTALWELLFLVEITKYAAAYKITGKATPLKRRYSIVLIVIGLLAIPIASHTFLESIFQENIYNYYRFISYLTVFIFFIINRIYGDIRFWEVLILDLCLTSLEAPLQAIFQISPLHLLFSSLLAETILREVCTILLLQLVYLVKKEFSGKTKLRGVGRKTIYVVYIISSVIFCLCCGALEGVTRQYQIPESGLFRTIAYLCFLAVAFLGMQIWYFIKLHEEVEAANASEKRSREIEREYYETMLSKDEEIRRYRHDMANHLISMHALIDQNQTAELKKYVLQLSEQFSQTTLPIYRTGHTVIDAINTYYRAKLEGVNVCITGRISDELPIDRTDLSTIYGNLLKNAVEEIQRGMEKGEEKLELSIQFDSGKNHFRMKIMNSITSELKMSAGIFQTSKKDSVNHGLGLRNVERAIQNQKGRFNTSLSEEGFLAEVVLPYYS